MSLASLSAYYAFVPSFCPSGYDFAIPSSRLHLAMQTLGVAIGLVGNYLTVDFHHRALTCPSYKQNTTEENPWCFAVRAAYSVVIILPLILHALSVVFLFGTRFEARHAFKLQATISFLLSWCSLMPSLLGGVQNPPAPAMKKAIRVSEWLFSVKFVPTERVKYANACEIACGSEIRLRRVEERILFHIDQSRRRREIFHNFR